KRAIPSFGFSATSPAALPMVLALRISDSVEYDARPSSSCRSPRDRWLLLLGDLQVVPVEEFLRHMAVAAFVRRHAHPFSAYPPGVRGGPRDGGGVRRVPLELPGAGRHVVARPDRHIFLPSLEENSSHRWRVAGVLV